MAPLGGQEPEEPKMFEITLINQTDGTVTGHRAGCADIKRGKKNADAPWTFEVTCKAEAREAYNADFDEETDGWYDINWLPCADHVPAEAEGTPEISGAFAAGPTIKVGRKWTTIHAADGSLIAEVRNDQVDVVLAILSK